MLIIEAINWFIRMSESIYSTSMINQNPDIKMSSRTVYFNRCSKHCNSSCQQEGPETCV